VRGKKFCRRWNYNELAGHVAAVCEQYDTADFNSKTPNSLWGRVTVAMGLANTAANRDVLYTTWRRNPCNVQVG
jgi:hypothetical protein